MGLFKKKTTDTPPSSEIEEPTLSEKIGDSTIEKGLPNLENPQGKSNMGKVGLFLGLLFATGLIAAGAIVFTSGDDETAATKKPEMDMVSNTQSHDFNQDKSAIKEQENLEVVAASDIQAASEPKAQEVPPINTTELPNHARQPETNETVQTVETPPEPKEPPIDPRLQGNVIVNVAGGGLGGNDETDNSGSLNYHQENSPFMATATQSGNGFSADEEDEKPKENTFANSLKPTPTPSVKAQKMGKRDFLLSKGTNILCTLDTQIITTRAGFTRCLITRDVYSANGRVLLLEKGSKIIGEQTTAMLHGQASVGILWNEVTTPKDVTVSLASPAAGQLGAAGMGARVKYHFWQRFSGAIMISLIGDLGDSYANRQNSGDGQRISFENSSEATQDMATEALKNSINIPPTAYINHGTLINIMVARDVDFSGVYEVVKPYEIF
ncbi:type IV secretion system protein VirB10 [Kingella kingae]|uniref:type IV secretion system protein VirB10 n=1 Tax=Kingella kingae TaxID=504 RepID=UPI0006915C37|nr:type IV secretion system protein VirB10 [Kingella kingae]MDK4526885.1 type IV secretion system protein VirB10 [Kingella kingae]MDK4532933.1 type IV secretion system protein VirB10 [Kingella kingae]MDK4535557.1 type IV secretion system protein VirB10 [Kingella kingae]MDK4537899.1 type IV secretion system protein VirB10 [Kingella kingae]MDK4546911.1 type IV secretion system protein VirB10 [Kingella kingae]